MPGLFSRLKTWVANEVLVYSDLNAEFDNIISNLEADTLGGYSATVAQMRSQVNPGGIGSESQAPSISGELERIRFAISRIVGKTYWYEAPTTSLSKANADLSWYFPCNGNSVSDVLNNFAIRGCRGVTRTVSFGSNGNITSGTIDADVASVSTSNVVSYSGGVIKGYSLLNTGFIAVDGNSLNANKGTLHIMFRNISAGDYLFHNKVLGLEVFANASGNLVVRATSRTAASQTTKQTFSATSATAVTGNIAFRQLFVDYVLNGAEGVSQDRLGFTIKDLSNSVIETGGLTGQSIQTYFDGLSDGIWYIGNKPADPASWTGYSAMSVRPDSETSPWTRTALGATDSVTNGILRTVVTGAGSVAYSKAISPQFGLGATYEWKTNLNANIDSTGMQQAYGSGFFSVELQDNATSRYFKIDCDKNNVNITVASGGLPVIIIPVNTAGPNVYRVTISTAASPVLNFYVNGAHVAQYTNSTAQAGANLIKFTSAPSAAVTNASIDVEYFAYSHGSITVPLALNASGNIDEACLFTNRVTDSALISSLNSAPVSDVLGKDKILGLRPLALAQPQIPGYTGSVLASTSQILGLILGDGQTDISISGIGLFGINTVAAASFRTSAIYYAMANGSLSAQVSPAFRQRDAVVNVYSSSHAILNCRSMSGLNPVSIASFSSDGTYNVLFSYAGVGLSVFTGQMRE